MDIIVVWNLPARSSGWGAPRTSQFIEELRGALSISCTDERGPQPQLACPHMANQRQAHDLGTCWGQQNASSKLPTGDADGIYIKAPCAFRKAAPDTELGAWETTDLTEEEVMHQYSSDTSALKHDWRSIAYTDGSCIEISLPEGKMQKIGAGLYIPSNAPGDQHFTIDPAGAGATNTINRAELAGIYGALKKEQRCIAVDSLASLCQIRKALRSPMDIRYHKHREMLEHIVGDIRQLTSDGVPLAFYKVKAHNGDIGNEIVDQTAKAAALSDSPCDLTVPVNPEPSYTKGPWLFSTQTAPGRVEGSRPRGLENFNHSLHSHMHERNRLGRSNASSVYYQAWQGIKARADCKISNSFLTHASITQAERKSALNWRFGTLWSNKIAFRCGMSKSAMCPLCGLPDSGGHITGGCSHPEMSKMYTERHHHTGRILLRAIAKGSMGGGLVMADVGSAEKCEQAGAPVLHLNRVPLELLPALADGEDLPTGEKRKLQPDAMIVQQSPKKEDTVIYIIEFKYCRDTQPEGQLAKCAAQHETLVAKLAENGFNRENIHLVPILIGTSGTAYLQHTLKSMEQIGISAYHAKKCALKMSIQAVKYLHSIVKTRRRIEHFAAGPGHHMKYQKKQGTQSAPAKQNCRPS
jgi:ribonuclease HI